MQEYSSLGTYICVGKGDKVVPFLLVRAGTWWHNGKMQSFHVHYHLHHTGFISTTELPSH
jgi:hypothetical protein